VYLCTFSEYFQPCKNIIERNNFVYIILLSRSSVAEIAFIGLDSTNSLYNNRFSPVHSSSIGSEKPRRHTHHACKTGI